MKVILSAFQDRLRSEPLDWPEELPPVIHLLLDISRFQPWTGEIPEPKMIFPKRGTFEKIDSYLRLKVNNIEYTAYIYELVDIN